MATFGDDTAILTTGNIVEERTEKLREAANQIHLRAKKWRIRFNDGKSTHVNFIIEDHVRT